MLVRFPHKEMESQCGTIRLGVLMLYYACVALLTGTSCNDGMFCLHDAQTDSHYLSQMAAEHLKLVIVTGNPHVPVYLILFLILTICNYN